MFYILISCYNFTATSSKYSHTRDKVIQNPGKVRENEVQTVVPDSERACGVHLLPVQEVQRREIPCIVTWHATSAAAAM